MIPHILRTESRSFRQGVHASGTGNNQVDMISHIFRIESRNFRQSVHASGTGNLDARALIRDIGNYSRPPTALIFHKGNWGFPFYFELDTFWAGKFYNQKILEHWNLKILKNLFYRRPDLKLLYQVCNAHTHKIFIYYNAWIIYFHQMNCFIEQMKKFFALQLSCK